MVNPLHTFYNVFCKSEQFHSFFQILKFASRLAIRFSVSFFFTTFWFFFHSFFFGFFIFMGSYYKINVWTCKIWSTNSITLSIQCESIAFIINHNNQDNKIFYKSNIWYVLWIYNRVYSWSIKSGKPMIYQTRQ